MTSVALYLDVRTSSPNSLYTVKIRITRNRKSFYLPTDVRVTKDEWDARAQAVIRTRQATSYNAYLHGKVADINRFLLTESTLGGLDSLSDDDLKERLKAIINYGEAEAYTLSQKGQFWALLQELTANPSHRANTTMLYKVLGNNLKRFDAGIESRTYRELNEAYWHNYLNFRRPKLSRNSIFQEFHRIKHVFAEAIKRGQLTANPCQNISLPGAVPNHRNLPVERLREVMTPRKLMERVPANIYKLSFLLRGMNLADLQEAKLEQIVNGRLIYDRLKTATRYSVKVEPEAMDIINMYTDGVYLIDPNLRKQLYRSVRSYCVKRGTSYYSARHSVASIASEIGVPLDIIAQILGHRIPELRMTLGYVTYKQDIVDKAMRRVIDYALYDKK